MGAIPSDGTGLSGSLYYGVKAERAIRAIKKSLRDNSSLSASADGQLAMQMINQSVIPIYSYINMMNLRVGASSVASDTEPLEGPELLIAKLLAISNAMYTLDLFHYRAAEIITQSKIHFAKNDGEGPYMDLVQKQGVGYMGSGKAPYSAPLKEFDTGSQTIDTGREKLQSNMPNDTPSAPPKLAPQQINSTKFPQQAHIPDQTYQTLLGANIKDWDNITRNEYIGMSPEQRNAFIEIVGRKSVLPQKTAVQKDVERAPIQQHEKNSEIRKDQLDSIDRHKANEKELKVKRGPLAPLHQLNEKIFPGKK